MKQWEKNNMRLFSKWRVQKREAAASAQASLPRQVTSRSQDVADEASKQAQKSEADGPMGPLACCSTPTANLDAAFGTLKEGGGDSTYHPFDEGKNKATQPAPTTVNDDPQPDQQQPVKANNDKEEEPQQHVIMELFLLLRQRSWKKKLLIFLVVATLLPVFLDVFVLRTGHVTSFLDDFLEWMVDHPLLGVWAYISMMIAASLIFVPPSILIFAAGFTFQALWGAWGIWIALLASFMGSTMGGLLGFWRVNYLTRDFVEVLMRRYPLIMAVDAAFVRNPLRVMLLLRLNCLIPFGVLNYMFGITGVGWEEFLLAMAGILPWHLLLIVLGASAETMYDDGTDTSLMGVILMAMGVAFGIIGLVILWKFAKKELQKSVDANPPSTAAGYRAYIEVRPWRSGARKVPGSIEEADMCATDYFYTLCLGHRKPEVDEGPEQEEEEYDRTNLTWSEIILDDFS